MRTDEILNRSTRYAQTKTYEYAMVQQTRPKRPPLRADIFIYSLISTLFGTILFYTLYGPYYVYLRPGVDFMHFAYVMIITWFSHTMGSIIGVVLLYRLLTNYTLRGAFKYFRIFSTKYLIVHAFMVMVNATVFMFGYMAWLQAGLESSMVEWFAIWIMVKLIVRFGGIFIAQFMQTRVVFLILFFAIFTLLFATSLTILYSN